MKHGRAAMIGITGMYFQTIAQDAPILQQLSEAFSLPNSVAKAGYFFPTEGNYRLLSLFERICVETTTFEYCS